MPLEISPEISLEITSGGSLEISQRGSEVIPGISLEFQNPQKFP